MTLDEIKEVTNILNRYYISSDLLDTIAYAYNANKKFTVILGLFTTEFDLSLDKEKYGITKDGENYIVYTGESILYLLHEYRNYLYGKANLPKIDALEYMVNDYKKYLVKKAKLNMTNFEWMAKIENNCYFETKKKTNKKLQVMLSELDNIINPYYDGKINDDLLKDTYLVKSNANNCILEIKSEQITKRYSRNKDGFCYTIFGNIKKMQLDISHYFKKDKEVIIANIDGIEISFDLTNNILKANGVILESNDKNMYLIYELLMSIIKNYNIEFYNKVKSFK